MGRQSTRANKNIYQICREECELTREKASEIMTGVSASRIEKIEYNPDIKISFSAVTFCCGRRIL